MRRIVAAFALVLMMSSGARAADGDLDTTFAQQGYEYFGWPNYLSHGNSIQTTAALLAQTDGKIVVVANVQFAIGNTVYLGVGVKRLLVDGAPDPSFGDGTVPGQIVVAPQNGDFWVPRGATLDANGNIIVVGYVSNATNAHAAVWKFTPNGVPQPSFGGLGSGMVVIDRGIDADDLAYAVIAGDGSNEPLGSLFIAGSINNVGAQHYDPAIFFLAADGSPLTTSIGVGNAILANGGRFWQGPDACPFDKANLGSFRLSSLSFDAQYFAGNSTHYLIAAGDCASNAFSAKVVVFALGSSSNLDPSFGAGGVSYLAFDSDFAGSADALAGMAVSFDASGNERITLAGYDLDASGHTHVGLARLRFNGQFDTSFGSGGQLVISAGACCNATPDNGEANAVLVQRDGKTVVGASVSIGTSVQRILLRLNEDGTGDGTFGSTGLLAGSRLLPQALPGSTFDAGAALAFTAGEKILFAGITYSTDNQSDYYSLARVQNDRIFTSTFDPLPVPL